MLNVGQMMYIGTQKKDEGPAEKKNTRKNYNSIYLGYELFTANYVLRFFYIDSFYKS